MRGSRPRWYVVVRARGGSKADQGSKAEQEEARQGRPIPSSPALPPPVSHILCLSVSAPSICLCLCGLVLSHHWLGAVSRGDQAVTSPGESLSISMLHSPSASHLLFPLHCTVPLLRTYSLPCLLSRSIAPLLLSLSQLASQDGLESLRRALRRASARAESFAAALSLDFQERAAAIQRMQARLPCLPRSAPFRVYVGEDREVRTATGCSFLHPAFPLPWGVGCCKQARRAKIEPPDPAGPHSPAPPLHTHPISCLSGVSLSLSWPCRDCPLSSLQSALAVSLFFNC